MPALSAVVVLVTAATVLHDPLAAVSARPVVSTWSTVLVAVTVQALPFLVLGVALPGRRCDPASGPPFATSVIAGHALPSRRGLSLSRVDRTQLPAFPDECERIVGSGPSLRAVGRHTV